MSGDWYVLLMGEQIGPLSDDQLREMVAKRQLTPDDSIRKGPSANWFPALRVRGLFSEAVAANMVAHGTAKSPPLSAKVAASSVPNVIRPAVPTAEIVSQPALRAATNSNSSMMYCQNCGSIVRPKLQVKGTFALEILLWCFFVIPGLAYTLWRLTTKEKRCPRCDAPNVIPLDSPKGGLCSIYRLNRLRLNS